MRGGNRRAGSRADADARIFGKESLPKAEGDEGNIPRILGKKRNRGFRRVYARPFLKRILRVQQVVVIKINFVAPPAEIVAEVASQSTFRGNVGCDGSNGDVVCVHGSERTVIAGVAGIEESIVVEIVAPRRLAFVVKPSQQGQVLGNFVHVVRARTGDGAEFALPDQALSKI